MVIENYLEPALKGEERGERLQAARIFIRKYPELKDLWDLQEIRDAKFLYNEIYENNLLLKRRDTEKEFSLLQILNRFDWSLALRKYDSRPFWHIIFEALQGRLVRNERYKEFTSEMKSLQKLLER